MLSFSDVVSLQTRVSVLNCPVYCSGFGVPKFTGLFEKFKFVKSRA